jgi:hypothetical protein
MGLLPGQQDLAPVQAGDYFEARQGGGVVQIAQIPPVPAVGPPLVDSTTGTPTVTEFLVHANAALPTGPATSEWRIIRAPRRLMSEEPVTLPGWTPTAVNTPGADATLTPSFTAANTKTTSVAGGVMGTGVQILFLLPVSQIQAFQSSVPVNPTLIPITTVNGTAYYMMSQNIPSRAVGANTYFEVVFSPAGNVTGQGSGADKIILWVEDTEPIAHLRVPPVLLTINIRTGMIGAYPVLLSPNPDPYASTKTGRSSGM